MTPESQRIAIAEICGWKKIHPDPTWWLHAGKRGHELCGEKNGVYLDIPNYPSDLNALHEAEMSLTLKQSALYALALAKVCNANLGQMLSASAPQRAKALLLALGKWDDSK